MLDTKGNGKIPDISIENIKNWAGQENVKIVIHYSGYDTKTGKIKTKEQEEKDINKIKQKFAGFTNIEIKRAEELFKTEGLDEDTAEELRTTKEIFVSTFEKDRPAIAGDAIKATLMNQNSKNDSIIVDINIIIHGNIKETIEKINKTKNENDKIYRTGNIDFRALGWFMFKPKDSKKECLSQFNRMYFDIPKDIKELDFSNDKCTIYHYCESSIEKKISENIKDTNIDKNYYETVEQQELFEEIKTTLDEAKKEKLIEKLSNILFTDIRNTIADTNKSKHERMKVLMEFKTKHLQYSELGDKSFGDNIYGYFIDAVTDSNNLLNRDVLEIASLNSWVKKNLLEKKIYSKKTKIKILENAIEKLKEKKSLSSKLEKNKKKLLKLELEEAITCKIDENINCFIEYAEEIRENKKNCFFYEPKEKWDLEIYYHSLNSLISNKFLDIKIKEKLELWLAFIEEIYKEFEVKNNGKPLEDPVLLANIQKSIYDKIPFKEDILVQDEKDGILKVDGNKLFKKILETKEIELKKKNKEDKLYIEKVKQDIKKKDRKEKKLLYLFLNLFENNIIQQICLQIHQNLNFDFGFHQIF